jgi:hypothetical protein
VLEIENGGTSRARECAVAPSQLPTSPTGLEPLALKRLSRNPNVLFCPVLELQRRSQVQCYFAVDSEIVLFQPLKNL